MTTKVCHDCGVDKPLDQFNRWRKSPDGRDYMCRQCSAARRHRGGTPRPRAARTAAASQPAPAPAPREPAELTTAATDFRPNREVVATFAAVQMIQASGRPAPNMLFIGPSGSGKTEQAKDLARRAGLPFRYVQAPSMVDPEAWFGTRDVVVENGAPKTVVTDSDFVRALQERCLLLVDEVNRTSDRNLGILLSVLDDTRAVTNPLTGQVVRRHPECYIVMTGNVGLSFTGTYALDPAFYTRALTTRFAYITPEDEAALAESRTGCAPATAALFARFAADSRVLATQSEDFEPISTREVLVACALVAAGLDADDAANQAVINAAASEGGAESRQGQLTLLWEGLRKRDAGPVI